MKDYIVLSGAQATVEGDYLRWIIHPSYFSHWKHGDEVYVKLASCNFVGAISEASLATEYGSLVIESDLVVQNLTNTSGRTVLSVYPFILYDGDGSGGLVVPSSESSNSPQLLTDRFNTIKIAVKYKSFYLNIDSTGFVAILEVEYKNHKDNMNELLKLIGQNGSGSIRAGNMV